MGTMLQSASRTLRWVRSTTTPNANATTTYVARGKCSGWGTIRVFCFTNQQVDLNLLQKPADGNPRTGETTPTFTMRETDSRTVAASPATQTNDFNVRGDYFSITTDNVTTAPTTFELEVVLLP